MATRNKNLTNQFDHGDYGYGDEYGNEAYGQEVDEEEQAIKESIKLAKKQNKAAKKAKGVQECDIDEMIKKIGSDTAFTRDQIKGTLENFKMDKDQTLKQLKFKIGKFPFAIDFR
jgi:hypothetical protein